MHVAEMRWRCEHGARTCGGDSTQRLRGNAHEGGRAGNADAGSANVRSARSMARGDLVWVAAGGWCGWSLQTSVYTLARRFDQRRVVDLPEGEQRAKAREARPREVGPARQGSATRAGERDGGVKGGEVRSQAGTRSVRCPCVHKWARAAQPLCARPPIGRRRRAASCRRAR
jgi:hypothetical protein